MIVFARERHRVAHIDDLTRAILEPFEPKLVILRPGKNATVLRAESYPHAPAEGLFDRGLPLY